MGAAGVCLAAPGPGLEGNAAPAATRLRSGGAYGDRRQQKSQTPIDGRSGFSCPEGRYKWWRWAERSQKTSNPLIPLIILKRGALVRRYLKRYVILDWSGGAAQALGMAILRTTPRHLQGSHVSTQIPPRVLEGDRIDLNLTS